MFRAVAVSGLPNAPAIVLGVVNIRGRIIPVINMRKRFGLPERDLRVTDRIVVALSGRRTIALAADSVRGVEKLAEPDIVPATQIVPGLEPVAGVVGLDDGLVLVHDLDRFLSLEEEEAIDRALVPDA